jgi:hypothetical protein
MANALASALVVDTAAEMAITVLQSSLAPLRAFTTDFSTDVYDPLKAIQVAVAYSTGSVTTNPTSFETADTTVNAAKVTMVHFSKSFGISSTELNQGHRLQRLMQVNLRALANALIDAALTPVTTVNFGVAVVTTSASFITAGGGSQTLWAALKNGTTRSLVVDGALYATMLPTATTSLLPGQAGAYGFDGGVYMNNRWNGAVTNCKGFAASPEAIAIAAALPAIDPSVQQLLNASETITIPDLGLSVQFNMWGSTSSRASWGSFDLVFGAKEADTSALKIITFA